MEHDLIERVEPRGLAEVGCGDHLVLVLADAGHEMWLLGVRNQHPPREGERFTYAGREWVLCRRADAGFVAHPAAD